MTYMMTILMNADDFVAVGHMEWVIGGCLIFLLMMLSGGGGLSSHDVRSYNRGGAKAIFWVVGALALAAFLAN